MVLDRPGFSREIEYFLTEAKDLFYLNFLGLDGVLDLSLASGSLSKSSS
jgi:hypothetical protein